MIENGCFGLAILSLQGPFASFHWLHYHHSFFGEMPNIHANVAGRLALAVRSLCVLILFCAIPQDVDIARGANGRGMS